MTFPSSVFLVLHISSLIQPRRVWGVWAQGWYCMAMDGLWFLSGLRRENQSIVWWNCHLFCHQHRDWSCMMKVGLWWAVVLGEIIIYFTLRGSSLILLWNILSMVWHTIPEGWRDYIRWTLIFSIDHLRVWEHDVWDCGCRMGGLYFG